jgi:hypothetical protein
MSQTTNILQRLHAVMQELDYLQKEKKNGLQYSFVSHDKVTGAVRPLLVKHGVVCWPTNFTLTQEGNRTQLLCQVVFASIDDKTDCIHVDSIGYGIDTQDKGPGKAVSYAVKYAMLKVLALETGDDPDQDQNAKFEPATSPASASEPKKAHDKNGIVRAEFDRLTKGIRLIQSTGNMEDLALFWRNNSTNIGHLPAEWKALLEEEKDGAKEALQAKAKP